MTPMTLVPINLLAPESAPHGPSPYITMSYGCKPFKHRITRFTYTVFDINTCVMLRLNPRRRPGARSTLLHYLISRRYCAPRKDTKIILVICDYHLQNACERHSPAQFIANLTNKELSTT